jgi:hypothetical protein
VIREIARFKNAPAINMPGEYQFESFATKIANSHTINRLLRHIPASTARGTMRCQHCLDRKARLSRESRNSPVKEKHTRRDRMESNQRTVTKVSIARNKSDSQNRERQNCLKTCSTPHHPEQLGLG